MPGRRNVERSGLTNAFALGMEKIFGTIEIDPAEIAKIRLGNRTKLKVLKDPQEGVLLILSANEVGEPGAT